MLCFGARKFHCFVSNLVFVCLIDWFSASVALEPVLVLAPQTHRDLPASASQALGLKACATYTLLPLDFFFVWFLFVCLFVFWCSKTFELVIFIELEM